MEVGLSPKIAVQVFKALKRINPDFMNSNFKKDSQSTKN